MHHIYLVPGFFGFAGLGRLRYFSVVADVLRGRLAAAGQRCEIFEVATLPTASLRRRAAWLLRAVRDSGGLDRADHVHLVGHSTGGLDGRLLAATLDEEDGAAGLAERLRTIVSVATPHRGTPLAGFFSTRRGQALLHFITMLIIRGLHRRRRGARVAILETLSLAIDALAPEEPLLGELNARLLRDLSPDDEQEVRGFLRTIQDDASLLVQLTPESGDLIDLLLRQRQGVRYVSYGAVSPAPRQALWRTALDGRVAPLGVCLYGLLHDLTAQPGWERDAPARLIARDLVTGRPLPVPLTPLSNDGIVPTLSQALGGGEFRGCVQADHLDVIGHFLQGGWETDWLASGARFDRQSFEALWGDVGDVLVGRS